MKKFLPVFFIALLLVGCKYEVSFDDEPLAIKKTLRKPPAENFGLVIHGGAGTILKENMSDSLEKAYRDKLEEAIRTGHTILEKGGTAMEAVTATINIMEDSPLFNAGKGAVFTHDGTNELDASVMDGKTLNAGAVAGVKRIKNP